MIFNMRLNMQRPAWFLLAAAVCLSSVLGQQTSLSVPAAFPCKSDTNFFDISSLQCQPCDQASGYFPSADQLSCILCDPTSGTDSSFSNGFVLTATWLSASLTPKGSCTCQAATAASVIGTMREYGRTFQRCLQCPSGTTPSSSQDGCIPASAQLRTPVGDLNYVLETLNAKGAGISTSTATQAVIQDVKEPSGSSRALTVSQSLPLTMWQGPAARLCMDAGDRAACNSLSNLCVLQMYSPDAAACQMYDELVALAAGGSSRRASSTSTLSPRPATGPLPWLYYVPGMPYLEAEDVDLEVSMSTAAPPLAFVLSVYDINGTWLGLHNWTLQFQVCGARVEEASKWTWFGVNYASSCEVDLSALLAQLDYSSNGPRFYDPYLMQANGELYPLPIKLVNKPEVTSSVSSTQQTGHVRRFFYIDTQLSASAAADAGSSQAVVFPSSMSLLIQIQPNARNMIFPPLLTLEYSAMRNTPSAQRLPTSFSVTYTNPPQLTGAFWYSWQTMVVVFQVLVGGPIWLYHVMRYMRKPNAPMDLEFLLYFVFSGADYLSGSLVIVLLLVSFYWLVLIKLQEGVLLLMLPDSQLYNFQVCVVLACVGQSIGILRMLYQQISVDIFFIDWEKPRRVLSKGGGQEEPGPISAWRSLLVANEWNELQTARMTYPSLTLIFMVFLLQGAHMQAAGYINPDQADYSTYANIQQSQLLRFGIAAVWFLVLGVAQVLWKVLFVHRFSGHPLHGFIDLLFLANTSAIMLDERHSGYYLHGRNQMHHSDTSLEELNGSLLREEAGLVAGRGLISSYTGSVASITGGLLASGPDAAALNDNQVFLMYVAPELRRTYESKLLSQVEQAAQEQRANKGAVTTAVRGPFRPRGSTISAYGAIAEAFKQSLDEVERNHTTQVIIPTYWQRMFRLPPVAAAHSTVLIHDFHHGFASVIFYGQELRLFLYEALLFCSLYMTLGNAAQAGSVTFIVQRIVAVIRQHWGENNLSRKTLVDRHFLI